jgi:hypothetical protein
LPFVESARTLEGRAGKLYRLHATHNMKFECII